MATKCVSICTCDICGIKIDKPYSGGEYGTYSLVATEDYAIAGGAGIQWKELCAPCNDWLGRKIADLQHFGLELKKRR